MNATGKAAARAGLAVAFLCLAGGHVRAGAVVRAEADPRRVAPDETLRLTVVIEGDEAAEAAAPSLSALTEWKVIAGPSVSTQVRFIEGVTTQVRSFTWVLAPPGPGTVVIPPLEVEVDGRRLRTESLTVTVTPVAGGPLAAPHPSPGAEGGGRREDDVLVRVVAEPQNPYVGQQVTLRYDLYTRADVTSVPQLQEVPSYPGFWSEEIESPRRILPREATVEGRSFRVYTIRKAALFPTTAGRQTLPPITFAVPVRGRSSPSFSGFLFDPVETLFKRTLPVDLDVRALPDDGRPEGFSGPVGRFHIDMRADRERATTGEAVSLTVRIEGDGNSRSIGTPTLDPAPDFTVYEPKVEQKFGPDATDRFSGSKTWNYLLIPRAPGRQALPAVNFAYFDPDAGRFKTLRSAPLEIEVSGQSLASNGGTQPPLQREIARLASDIHFIKATQGPSRPAGPPPYRTVWFWAGLALPPAANVAAFTLRWSQRRRRARMPEWLRRRARRTALRSLKQAASETSDAARFHAAVARVLTDYVADKVGRPAGGLTYDRLAELLARHSVPEPVCRLYLEVLQECDWARFAPDRQGAPGRNEALCRARAAIQGMEPHL